VCLQEQQPVVLSLKQRAGGSERPMPPRAWPVGLVRKKVPLGSVSLKTP